MNVKVIVDHEWDPELTDMVDLAVMTPNVQPAESDWRPALRDTIDGRRVVWIRADPTGGRVVVWLRDRNGTRPVHLMEF